MQSSLGADRVGAQEDPVLPRGQPSEDLGFHRLGTNEPQVGLQPTEGVGEKLANSSRVTRTSSSQSRSSGAKVTNPAASASAARSGLPNRPRARSRSAALPPKPAPQAGQTVCHRVPAVIGVGEFEDGDSEILVGRRAVEHEGTIGRQRQLTEGAGETAPWLDQGDQ